MEARRRGSADMEPVMLMSYVTKLLKKWDLLKKKNTWTHIRRHGKHLPKIYKMRDELVAKGMDKDEAMDRAMNLWF